MKALLRRMLDETAFLRPTVCAACRAYISIIRSMLDLDGQHFSVGYVPGESSNRAFGGNSNWRGPVWMPVNFMFVESLYGFHRYYGDDFRVEYPIGSGMTLSLKEIADALSERLTGLFLRGPDGRRPVFGDAGAAAGRSAVSRSRAVPRIFPWRHRPAASARRIRPAGPGSSRCCCTDASTTILRGWTC